MAKSRRRRKQAVTITPAASTASNKSISGHHLIRRFHLLLKQRELLVSGSTSASYDLDDVENEIRSLGGLEAYQTISAQGQSEERGGGSEKVFVAWLKELRENEKAGERLRLLEVGAVKHDSYARHATWIDCTPIDLRSRHPMIQEQDFLKLDERANYARWDGISLSLVLNFVPSPHSRGRMLSLAYAFLREGGYMFMALPLPCVANSRYLNFDRLKHIMSAVGFTLLKERWKLDGKMGYWLFLKNRETTQCIVEKREQFKKKYVLREGKNRNNFAILL